MRTSCEKKEEFCIEVAHRKEVVVKKERLWCMGSFFEENFQKEYHEEEGSHVMFRIKRERETSCFLE